MNKYSALVVSIILTALCVTFFLSNKRAYEEGIKHAIEDSLITIESNEILIDLDGQIYVHSED